MTHAKNALAVLLVALFATACSSNQARIMDDGEDDLVDRYQAGIATFDRLIEGAVGEMLDWYTDEVLEGEAASDLKVAFAGVENRTAEPLSEMREAVATKISTSIKQYKGFDVVSERYVTAGLRETGLTTEDLMLPAKRRQFLEVMERSDNPAAALVFATLTRATSRSGGDSQARYTLTLEMVDSESGVSEQFDKDVNKAYSR